MHLLLMGKVLLLWGLNLLGILIHRLHVRIHMSLVIHALIQPALVLTRISTWLLHKWKWVEAGIISSGWSGLRKRKHVLTTIHRVKMSETIINSDWIYNFLRIAISQSILCIYITTNTIITFIYIIESPKSLIFDYRVTLRPFDWCLKMTKIWKSTDCSLCWLRITLI